MPIWLKSLEGCACERIKFDLEGLAAWVTINSTLTEARTPHPLRRASYLGSWLFFCPNRKTRSADTPIYAPGFSVLWSVSVRMKG